MAAPLDPHSLDPETTGSGPAIGWVQTPPALCLDLLDLMLRHLLFRTRTHRVRPCPGLDPLWSGVQRPDLDSLARHMDWTPRLQVHAYLRDRSTGEAQ